MCFRNKNEKCVITTDSFNELLQKIKDVDGIILGSPVHFSGIAGTMKCFLDRAFYVSGANGNWFRHKVGAAIVAVRRSGGSTHLTACIIISRILKCLFPHLITGTSSTG